MARTVRGLGPMAGVLLGLAVATAPATARGQATEQVAPAVGAPASARPEPLRAGPAPESSPRLLFGLGGTIGTTIAAVGAAGLGLDLRLGVQLNDRFAAYGSVSGLSLLVLNQLRTAAVFDVTLADWFSIGTGAYGASHGCVSACSANASAWVVGVPIALNFLAGGRSPVTGRRSGFHLGLTIDVGVMFGGEREQRSGLVNDIPVGVAAGGHLTLGFLTR